ncbi:MAG: hypothetical protein V3U32_01345 [Anaerolineales bacterium]
MTERLYHQGLYIQEFEAAVAKLSDGWMTLEGSATYPGGTHVDNMSDVGRIRVVDYKSKGRINKRLVFELED